MLHAAASSPWRVSVPCFVREQFIGSAPSAQWPVPGFALGPADGHAPRPLVRRTGARSSESREIACAQPGHRAICTSAPVTGGAQAGGRPAATPIGVRWRRRAGWTQRDLGDQRTHCLVLWPSASTSFWVGGPGHKRVRRDHFSLLLCQRDCVPSNERARRDGKHAYGGGPSGACTTAA